MGLGFVSVRFFGDRDTIDQGIHFKNASGLDHTMNMPKSLPSVSAWNTLSSFIFLAVYVVLHSQFTSCSHGKPPFVYFSVGKAEGLVLLVSASVIIYCLTVSFHITLLAFRVTTFCLHPHCPLKGLSHISCSVTVH